ncbi:MAG: glycosyltransferase family 87 protein, partial [bacterium]|nr:glycosyltransferase family 87 protein [bacterium]
LLIFSIKIISQEPSTLKLFIILSWFPIFTTFSYGQNSIFFLFILASAIKCLRQGYLFQSGLLTGVLALKPQLLPAFLIAWACAGKKGITGILGIIISISSLVLVSYLFMPESSQAYLSIVKSELFQIEKVSGFSYAKQHTLMSFFHLLFGDLVAAKIFCFVLMLFAIYFTRSIFIKYKNNEHLIFSFGALLLPCVSPYLMIYDLCLLIIPALVIWDEFKFSKIFSKKIYSFIWIVIPLNVTLLIPLQSRFLPWSIHFAELGLLVTFALIVNKMLTEDCLSIQSKT